MADNNLFGIRIKGLRKAVGAGQVEAADKTGVHLQTFSKYERGDRKPDIEFLSRLAHAYGVNLNWLLLGEGEMFGVAGGGNATGLDKELVRVVIEAVEEGLGDLQLELKPDKKAQLVITLCEMFEEEKKVDKPTLLRLIRLAA